MQMNWRDKTGNVYALFDAATAADDNVDYDYDADGDDNGDAADETDIRP